MTDDPHSPPDRSSSALETETAAETATSRPSAIVGIGGAEGALDGYARFFHSLPEASGLAFVLVPSVKPGEHLTPDLLQRYTSLPVLEARDGMPIEAERVYVPPARASLLVEDGALRLQDLQAVEGRPLNAFLTSLAADQQDRAVAVILSGSGNDGTRGVRAIKEGFGLALVQEPSLSHHPAMPTSVIASGLADHVLPIEDLAPRLNELVMRERHQEIMQERVSDSDLRKILQLVRQQTGQDFSRYKTATLQRRIDRRMAITKIGHSAPSAAEYLRYLQEHPEEVEALYDDLTINVTNFFRDLAAFDQLKVHLSISLPQRRRDGEAIRVWVVGCASGEEAYSVSILLHELTHAPGWTGPTTVQVFATDIDQRSIERARLGQYPRRIEQDVTPERLQRYFTESDTGYQIIPQIRDTIVFARHNTYGDPPFTGLDLLCCRNMLIYLNPELQKSLMSVFHYALRADALLFLGASETIGLTDERFESIDPRWKLYRRRPGRSGPLPVETLLTSMTSTALPSSATRANRPPQTGGLPPHVQRLLLTSYVLPSVVVTAQGSILYVNGRTSRFLEMPSGTSSTSNVLDMTRDGLRFKLAGAMQRAVQEGRTVVLRDVQPSEHETAVVVDVTVHPLPPQGLPSEGETLLIVFQEHQANALSLDDIEPGQVDQVQELTRELQHLRDTLQATMEQNATSTEELRSTNEEYQTTIEELKSTNEELLTSKEELQSVNEELITTNAEHQGIIHDLAQSNDDMKNLLESSGNATLFLGNDLRIKRFTPMIGQIVNLLRTDVGRHINDINVKLRATTFEQHVADVLETLQPLEMQVETLDGHWYLMRITPYRTASNFIDGVVVTFTNVDTIRAVEEQLDHTRLYSESLLNSILNPLVVFDDDLRVVTANRALFELLRVSSEQISGRKLADLGSHQLDQPELLERLTQLVLTDEPVLQFVIDLDIPGKGVQKRKAEAWTVVGVNGQQALHLMQLEDVTSIIQAAAQEGETFTGDAADLTSEK